MRQGLVLTELLQSFFYWVLVRNIVKLPFWVFRITRFRLHLSGQKYLKQVSEEITISCKGESFHSKIDKEWVRNYSDTLEVFKWTKTNKTSAWDLEDLVELTWVTQPLQTKWGQTKWTKDEKMENVVGNFKKYRMEMGNYQLTKGNFLWKWSWWKKTWTSCIQKIKRMNVS